MNKGNNVKPKYVCDKCGEQIRYYARRGLVGRYNYGIFRDYSYHKAFDLCSRCNRELKEWLKEKPINLIYNLSVEDVINKFEIYEGDE